MKFSVDVFYDEREKFSEILRGEVKKLMPHSYKDARFFLAVFDVHSGDRITKYKIIKKKEDINLYENKGLSLYEREVSLREKYFSVWNVFKSKKNDPLMLYGFSVCHLDSFIFFPRKEILVI